MSYMRDADANRLDDLHIKQELDANAADIAAETINRVADVDAEQAARIAADLLLIPLTQKGAAGGVATLDGGAKIPANQLPSSVMEYKGVWNATTNTPTLADGVGDSGDTYRVTVAGTQNLGSGPIQFNVGDLVIYDGTVWQKSDSTDAVTSVAGLVGTVTASDLKTALSLPADTASDLAAESAARIAADSAEATTRGNADTTLQNNITAEATTRGAADTTLQNNINTEAGTRGAADTVLQNNITAEASTRSSADLTLQTQIDTINATKIGTLAYAENTCSNASFITSITTAAAVVSGAVVTIEPTTADVWFEWGAALGVSVVGAGFITLRLNEVTDAGAAVIKSSPIRREVTAGFVTAFGQTFDGCRWRLGPTATTRQFYLDVILVREAASSLAAYLCNSYNNGAGSELAKTWLAAIAE